MPATPETATAGPFLRWAGSKRWLVPRLIRTTPSAFEDYYEPFLGSATAFFAVAHGHHAYLSDTIGPLINCYSQVRDSPTKVAEIASAWPTDSETYYEVRSDDQTDDLVTAAARFIYLNKLCFNGLYRENQRGKFNVPYGRPKNDRVADEKLLLEASARLATDVELATSDFEDALADCSEGDFVYLDPPYVAGHRTNGFVDYNSKIFSWQDQRRLAAVFKVLDARGVFVALSNADHESVRALYGEYEIEPISRYSSMSGNGGGRGQSAELLILGRTLQQVSR